MVGVLVGREMRLSREGKKAKWQMYDSNLLSVQDNVDDPVEDLDSFYQRWRTELSADSQADELQTTKPIQDLASLAVDLGV